MHIKKPLIRCYDHHVASAAVTDHADNRPTRIGRRIPCVHVAAHLAHHHHGMAASAQQRRYKTTEIHLHHGPCAIHFSGHGVRYFVRMQSHQITHYKLFAVIRFHETAQDLQIRMPSAWRLLGAGNESVYFICTQGATPVVVPGTENSIQNQCQRPYPPCAMKSQSSHCVCLVSRTAPLKKLLTSARTMLRAIDCILIL